MSDSNNHLLKSPPPPNLTNPDEIRYKTQKAPK